MSSYQGRTECIDASVGGNGSCTPSAQFRIEFLDPSDAQRSPAVWSVWRRLVETSKNPCLLYQSPEWWDHLVATEDNATLSLGVVWENCGDPVGVLPIRFAPHALTFAIKRQILLKQRVKAVSILGSLPLIPDNLMLYRAVWRDLFGRFSHCDCIRLDSVACDSVVWGHLQGHRRHGSTTFVYFEDGVRPFHVVELSPSFETYLEKFSSKQRYNLKREVKCLREHGQGVLEMLRVESEHQVESFLAEARRVSEKSWQHARLGTRIQNGVKQRDSLIDLARRHILRSYLLRCGGKPCAFVVGYHYRDVFHYVEVGYDPTFARFSPGRVLLYLLLEDLSQESDVRIVNFGVGDSEYKRQFGTIHMNDASIGIWRNSFCNRVLCTSHKTFLMSRECLKRVLRHRRVTGPGKV